MILKLSVAPNMVVLEFILDSSKVVLNKFKHLTLFTFFNILHKFSKKVRLKLKYSSWHNHESILHYFRKTQIFNFFVNLHSKKNVATSHAE